MVDPTIHGDGNRKVVRPARSESRELSTGEVSPALAELVKDTFAGDVWLHYDAMSKIPRRSGNEEGMRAYTL